MCPGTVRAEDVLWGLSGPKKMQIIFLMFEWWICIQIYNFL